MLDVCQGSYLSYYKSKITETGQFNCIGIQTKESLKKLT